MCHRKRDPRPRHRLRAWGTRRLNDCRNPYLFRDTMLKLIGSPSLEYKQLTAKVQDAAWSCLHIPGVIFISSPHLPPGPASSIKGFSKAFRSESKNATVTCKDGLPR